MTIEQCFQELGENYKDVLDRMLTGDRVEKFLRRFSEGSYMVNLTEAVEKKDYDLIFRESHTLKGLCLNLGLSRLGKASAALCESVKGGVEKEPVEPLLDAVKVEYDRVMEVISKL